MDENLVESVRVLRAALVDFQPEQFSGEDCAVLVEELATVEKVCAAARVRAAARAGMCGEHKERGFADVSDWMARDRRVRAIDPEELHSLQHAAKHARHWHNRLGNVVVTMELPPEFGVPFTNQLDAETDRVWQEHRRAANRAGRDGPGELFDDGSSAGMTPPRSMLAADAFMRMFESGRKGKAHQADLVIVCDLRAYRRGHAEEGEQCHSIGGGPIPVSLAQELGRDAFLKAVLHDGTEIHTIAHFGRRYPAVLRTALILGAPPEFEGPVCSEPGCDRRYHLEHDHIDPCANGGKTTYNNLASPCWPHHRVKTERDRKAGLLRGKPRGPD